jgi:UDP-N-acetylmuramate: L-alanyl-gamma-D-glutamyl-meso-diaminopimelate ligase
MRAHFVGVGGRAMGGIAMALARAGHHISGSDECLYEPMRGWLESQGIRPTPFDPANVPRNADAVVVGRRITDQNPELRLVRSLGLRHESFPCFLKRHFLGHSRNAVIAGGVGKTTTTAMLAWILEDAGLKPDFLIGGIARNFRETARFDEAEITVLEGDEYASGVDDDSPKFLHYAPEVVAVTNLLSDHPDLYPDASTLLDAFGSLVRLLPKTGCLVLGSDEDGTDALAALSPCEVRTVGTREKADMKIGNICLQPSGSAFTLGGARFNVPMHGLMNIHNAARASVVASHFGVSYDRSARALARFEGLIDRQEAAGVGGRTIVRDKASHPRSILELADALRQRYPDQRLISVSQPRATGGREWIYQRDLPMALAGFDKVILTRPYEHKPRDGAPWKDQPFSIEALFDDLRGRNVDVEAIDKIADLPEAVRRSTRPGDVVLLSLREQFGSTAGAIAAALAS